MNSPEQAPVSVVNLSLDEMPENESLRRKKLAGGFVYTAADIQRNVMIFASWVMPCSSSFFSKAGMELPSDRSRRGGSARLIAQRNCGLGNRGVNTLIIGTFSDVPDALAYCSSLARLVSRFSFHSAGRR